VKYKQIPKCFKSWFGKNSWTIIGTRREIEKTMDEILGDDTMDLVFARFRNGGLLSVVEVN